MINKIINIANRQLENEDIIEMFLQEEFFREYMSVFNANKYFKEETSENVKILKHDCALKQNIMEISNLIIKEFKVKLNELKQLGIQHDIGLILYIGDNNVEGHGILIENQGFVYVNLAVMLKNIKDIDLGSFMAHEIMHAVHYTLNNEFYPGNYKTPKDTYMKLLFEEGMATYTSMRLFNLLAYKSYWLGSLSSDEVEQWIYNCENCKLSYGEEIEKEFKSPHLNKELYSTLFTVKNDKDIKASRIAYYYGAKIVSMLNDKMGIDSILLLDYKSVEEYIYKYFEIYN